MSQEQLLDEKRALMRLIIEADGHEVSVSSNQLAREMAGLGPRVEVNLSLMTKAGIFLALLEKHKNLPGFAIRELEGRTFRLGFKKVQE